MARVGFKMMLKEGSEAEYARRHDEVWPNLQQLLHDTGIRNYSIYRDGPTLFAYLEIDDPGKLEELAKVDLMGEWWRHMGPLMECNPDSSPVVVPLVEVFHMD